jgi:hypothetical protein
MKSIELVPYSTHTSLPTPISHPHTSVEIKTQKIADQTLKKVIEKHHLIKRNLACQALDIVGYIPLVGVGAGAVRAILGIAIGILATMGCMASSALGYKTTSEKCALLGYMALSEACRGLWQEMLAGAIPGVSLRIDLTYEGRASRDLSALDVCARGRFISYKPDGEVSGDFSYISKKQLEKLCKKHIAKKKASAKSSHIT